MSLSSLEQRWARALLAQTPPLWMQTERTSVYRTLVRNNLNEAIESFLPRTASRLGISFWNEVDIFYENRGPQTHYLRDVPAEFVAWAEMRWPYQTAIPAYLLDLARHELIVMRVSAAPKGAPSSETQELRLDAPVVFATPSELIRYHYAVHELAIDAEDRQEPIARHVALLLYRDTEHNVRFLELSPTAAAIVENLLVLHHPLEAALREGAAATDVPFDDALLSGTAALLSDLSERGVLLGGALQKTSSVLGDYGKLSTGVDCVEKLVDGAERVESKIKLSENRIAQYELT